MIEIDIHIDSDWTHFELEDTLKIIKMNSNTNNKDDEDIEYAVRTLNSPFDKNGYWFKIKYDDNKKLWKCKRIVPFYDGCKVILTTYHNDYSRVLIESCDVFYKLQQIYNSENISF